MDPTQLAKAYALEKTGLDWDEKDQWSDAERREFLAANAEFRRARPELFTVEELRAADNYGSAGAQPEIEFSYVGEFLKEAGNQVKDLNAQLNPFSEENRARTRNVVIALVLLVGAVWAGVWAWRTSPRNPFQKPPGDDFPEPRPAAPKRKAKK